MISQTDIGDDDVTIRSTLRFRWSLIIGIAIQTVALVGWLVQMHADVAYLKVKNEEQDRLIARLDEGGSRKLAVIEERQQLLQKSINESNVLIQKTLEAIIQHMNSMPTPKP